MGTSPFTLRAATRADRAALVAFHHMLYADHQPSVMAAEDLPLVAYADLGGALRDDVDAMLESRDAIVLLAHRDEEPIGYATGHVELDPRRVLGRRGVVGDWLVVPEARGAGVGRALLEALLDAFRARGCAVAESQTWPLNTAGRAAHESLGFRAIRVVYRRPL